MILIINIYKNRVVNFTAKTFQIESLFVLDPVSPRITSLGVTAFVRRNATLQNLQREILSGRARRSPM